MASNGRQQPNAAFEDQFRQMIIQNNQNQPNAPSPNQNAQPTVRLPPQGAYQTQQTGYQQPPPEQRTPQDWHGSNFASPQNRYGPPPPNHSMTNYNTRGMQQPGYPRPHHPRQPRGGYGQVNQPSQHAPGPQQRSRNQQPVALDPNAFNRGGFARPQMGRGGGAQNLFNPNQPRMQRNIPREEQHARQTAYLEQLASKEIGSIEMTAEERHQKESFRTELEKICHAVCASDPERLPQISLESFGSFQSGFATAGSDMDLVIVVKDQKSASACFSLLEDDLPRALEKKLLDLGYGARLLTRTRVPIIKVAEKPGDSFLDKLREERWKWDDLPNEKKYPHLHAEADAAEDEIDQSVNDPIITNMDGTPLNPAPELKSGSPVDSAVVPNESKPSETSVVPPATGTSADIKEDGPKPVIAQQGRQDRSKTRERRAGPLDFPKTGVGIHTDINFSNELGLHNTQLLRCYSLCDDRVRPMILFVKAWAKKRKINSSYSGTLSSYGYVLMVLHYLVNVANPPVLPNLQGPHSSKTSKPIEVNGWEVYFWNDEQEIMNAVSAAQDGRLTGNRESLGSLLSGFFQYYSSLGGSATFHWMSEVLSLSTQGGIKSKEEKGWTKAMTEESGGKRVQHRYLFCIEDPFELNHNVARTVTHFGIVAIRDEFRRAKRILDAVAHGTLSHEGNLCDELIEAVDDGKATHDLETANGATHGAVHGTQETPKLTTAMPPAMDHTTTNRRSHEANQKTAARGRRSPWNPSEATRTQPKSFDVHDSETFPSLGPTKPLQKKTHSSREQGNFSEISGAKAKAHLAEIKRLKDEAEAESTATGAAEAVLNGID